MKKYLLVFKLAVQSILQYRFNVLLYMLFGILPLVAILYLWIEIFRNKESINGFTLEMMITYVILAKVLEMALIPQIQWTIHDDVRTGEISKYIYKPVDYLLYWFSHNLGYKVTYLVASLI
ncbi:ABC-2 family transporter protein, partial [Priestia aryabhattai]|uniref:ABC-2 family transporter protein n=1 Tax=Priestia aryabhattai TaxID=412384 RepID=UPI002E1D4693|nr:ABC-2 family transporter protein [Priestia aryabhattai]